MRVLIIDDAPDYVALLERYLRKQFPDVETRPYLPHEHGGQLPPIAEIKPDLILLDYQLDIDSDGLDWLRQLRTLSGCPPIIFMTAQGSEYVAVEAIRNGASDYVKKVDLNAERLAQAVRGVGADTQELDWDIRTGPKDEPEPAPTKPKETGTRTSDASDAAQTGGYRVRRRIGQGAMSKVYLAERLEDGMSLALKLIDLKNLLTEEVRVRFIKEAELASSINSPYVVRIDDYGITPEYGFMVMELFTRGDLKQSIAHGLSADDALLCMLNIAYSLEVIHEAGIVHRDLKPENIMFRSDGSMALADFGISKVLRETTMLTTLGKVLGTPHYMSPEQGQGFKVDHRTDLYSAGIIFFEMLTGMRPFDAHDPVSMIMCHVNDPVPLLPGACAHLQPILNRLLAKDPDERFPHASALIAELRTHLA